MRGRVAKQIRKRAKRDAKPGAVQKLYEQYKSGFKKIKQAQSASPKLKQSRRQQRISKKQSHANETASK